MNLFGLFTIYSSMSTTDLVRFKNKFDYVYYKRFWKHKIGEEPGRSDGGFAWKRKREKKKKKTLTFTYLFHLM